MPPARIKKPFRSSTQFPLVIYRTQLFGPEDMPNVVKVQSGYKAQPLSAYLNQSAPPTANAINFSKINKQLVRDRMIVRKVLIPRGSGSAPMKRAGTRRPGGN